MIGKQKAFETDRIMPDIGSTQLSFSGWEQREMNGEDTNIGAVAVAQVA